ncbi:hypothetical protein IT409_01505, partial [Candidatus Falkowbacteria bacterium]|nr:hypothetical protein [Candidatus Falkowbacteria bacterium]
IIIMKPTLWLILWATTLNAMLYSGNARDFFVSDDFDWLHLTKFGDPLWQAFVGNYYGHHGVGGAFRPLVNVFFELGHLLGSSPLLFHGMQFALHTLVVVMVGLLARQLIEGKFQNHAMFVSALIFSLMPFHSEAVIWISAIGDPLATLLFLVSLYCYVGWRQRGGALLFFMSLAALGGSLITKEIAIVFPLVAIAYELCIVRNYKLLALARAIGIHVVMVAGYLLYRNWAIGVLAGYYAQSNLQINVVTYAHNFGVYLITFFVSDKTRLWLVETLNAISPYLITGITITLLVVLLIAGIMMLVKKASSRSIFFVSFIAINLALVSPLAMSSLSDEGERYVYIASVGLAWLITTGGIALWQRQKIVTSLLAIALIGYWGTISVIKNAYWSDASNVSHALYEQLRDIPFERYKKVYFVGIPETFEGAQVMRNGVPQAIAYASNNRIHNVERIPVYQVLDATRAFDDLYGVRDVRERGIHFVTRNNAFSVTGDAAKQFGEYKFELWNYLYTKPIADTIHLEFSGGREYDWARGEIALYYFDNGRIAQIVNEQISK